MTHAMKPTDHHEAVFAELDWYANGTLAANDRVRVRKHLAACAVCRSELQLIERSMAAAMDAPQPDAQAVEQALARTLARIEREAAAASAGMRRAASPITEATASPTAQATVGPTAQATAGPAAQATAGPTAQATAGPTSQATASPTAEATASPGPVPRLRRWIKRAAHAWRAAASRPLMLGAATVAAISLLVVAPMALRQASNDDYRVLTNGSDASAGRVVLRVTFNAETSRAQVASLLGDAARDTTIEQLGAADYVLRLPPTADLDAVSRLHERFARDATVGSVKLDVGAR